MGVHYCEYILTAGSRQLKRVNLITCFLEEKAGTGKGDKASRYQYNVESFGDYRIFLKRPTRLNKGFDFTVNIQGLYFKKKKKYSNPSHQDIFDALSVCRDECPIEYSKVKDYIIAVFECKEIDLSDINAYFFDYEHKKHPIQIIILAIKWLFMEQDCAYWNYSGRRMFFNELRERSLC